MTSVIIINSLKRTESLGETIILVGMMINELVKFLFTFGLLILLSLALYAFLADDVMATAEHRDVLSVLKIIFGALNGN